MKTLLISILALLSGCVSIPQNIQPVASFKADQYLGQWYEIARMDHRFERGLSKVTANYSKREDGGIKVVNRGFSASDNKWTEAVGKAYFVASPEQGHLKVSFFGPIYASYIVFELDQANYQYAMVSGPDKGYFWLLSRTPKISDDLKERLLAKANSLGYDRSKILMVDQE
jgi:apolipoprotein D and lipocalin family protein